MSRRVLLVAVGGLALAGCRTETETPGGPDASPGVAEDITPAVADEVRSSMDLSVDPCDDFFRYACGSWIDNTELPADEPRFGRFNVLRERNLAALRGILDTAVTADPSSELASLGTFYGSCTDDERVNARGAEPLAAGLLLTSEAKDLAGIMGVVGDLHGRGVPTLFGLEIGPDLKDPSLNIAQFGQGGLGLPDRDYYLRPGDEAEALRTAYRAHVAEVLGAAGMDGSVADAVVAFETKVAEVSKPRDELRDPEKQYNRVTPAELAALTPNMNWDAFRKALGKPSLSELNVAPPEFFAGLDALLASTDVSVLKGYLAWQLVHAFAEELHAPIANAHYAFFDQKLRGQRSPTPRWKHCVQATDKALGELLGQQYVEQHFAGSSRGLALDMIQQIESAFAQGLPQLAWMGESTRTRAVEKMEAIVNKIGYPDVWRDYTAVALGKDHFENVAAARVFEARRKLAQVGKPVDKGEWYMSPQTVNAYYNPPYNEMVFPAGILQPPFFHPDYPMAMNFGGIGMVMGHELTHGFDDQGRKFDGDGKMRQWWDADAVKGFEERAACVEDLYDGYEVQPGLHLNGKLTLGENIADFGGIKQAHRAYTGWAQGAGKDPKGNAIDGLTREQLFFVSFGQIWCSKATPEIERVLAVTDPHSHARYRVNGPLSHLPAFSEAFSCEPGEPMRPANACEVW